MLTILQYFGLGNGDKDEFRLRECDIRTDLNGLRYDDLRLDSAHEKDIDSLLNQSIRSVIIRNWTKKRVLELIFIRLNTGSVPLSPHELRLALMPGPFTSFVDEASYGCQEIQKLLGIKGPDFRMRDSELITRFLSFKFRMSKYEGDLSKFMDDSSIEFNAEWMQREPAIKKAFAMYKKALGLILDIFQEKSARKWVNDGYESRFNRAILDSMVYFFSDEEIYDAAILKKQDIEEGFKKLCENSQEYMDAIGVTTKKIDSVFKRHYLWGQSLSAILDLPIRLPVMEEGRIKI